MSLFLCFSWCYSCRYVVQPDVPPEVLKYKSVADQSEEMRRWFHAWQDEDPQCPTCKKLDAERVKAGLKAWDTAATERYYPTYFRPILCVLEGAWIKQTDKFEESFASDRHFVDAKDWRELYDKNRFLYQSGRKSTQENLPFLPLSVRGLQGTLANETRPVFAHWEYRIICSQPLQKYVPLSNFRVASDLAVQLGISTNMMTLEELGNSRKARFEVNAKNQTAWVEGQYDHSLIDDLMGQIPGKDGYGAYLTDDSFGVVATEVNNASRALNTAFYSRYYSIGTNDAMGRSKHRRGFNDPYLFAAMTTQKKIQGVTSCTAEVINGAGGECTEAVVKQQKWTWAVPLEIIYTTPLANWNPYNLTYCPYAKSDQKCKHTIQGPSGDRDGKLTDDKAFKGTARDTLFITPEEFYSGADEETDPADTSGGVMGVLDQNDVLRKVRGAGHWVHWPAVKGFKKPIRQRYPIMPIHEHGKTSWKEVKALQDIVIDAGGSSRLRAGLNRVREERIGVALKLKYTSGTKANVGAHEHTMHVSGKQLKEMDTGSTVKITTSYDNSHSHDVWVTRQLSEFVANQPLYQYKMTKCDTDLICGDKDGYTKARQEFDKQVMDLKPWAFYTKAESTFTAAPDGSTAQWKDSSGNNRHTLGLSNYKTKHKSHPAPFLNDMTPAPSSVVFNRYQGLRLPNGSIPEKFTIFMRAKYMKATDATGSLYTGRLLQGRERPPDWYMGWDGCLGETVFAGVRPNSRYDGKNRFCDNAGKYSYHTVAGRTTQNVPVWIDGAPTVKETSNWAADYQSKRVNIALALGAAATFRGPDFSATDLIIFDKELTDEQVKAISTGLNDINKRGTSPPPIFFSAITAVLTERFIYRASFLSSPPRADK